MSNMTNALSDKFSLAIGVRLTAAERSALERAAEADDRSVSSMARRILDTWLRERGFLRATDE